MTEYRDITEFSDYRVGSDGSILSCKTGAWQPMKSVTDGAGYGFVVLRSGARRVQRNIHRLVLEAFVGPYPEGMVCRHLDGNKTNNQLENLRWGTRPENYADSMRHGTAGVGVKARSAKLNDELVRQIRSRRRSGATYRQLAKEFGLSYAPAWQAINGKTWKHVA